MSEEKKEETQPKQDSKPEEVKKAGRDINKHYERYKDNKWDKDTKELLNKGPISDENRKCQDIICCLIFIAFLVGCVIVTILGFSGGNPDLVLYPYDEDGRQCGMDPLLEYKYLYFYAAVANLREVNLTGVAQGVCVSSCPVTYTGFLNCTKTNKNPGCTVEQSNFYVSTPFLNRFCIPDPLYKNSTTITPKTITIDNVTYQEVPSKAQSDSASFINYKVINTDKLIAWMTDLITTWPIILASVGFALVIGVIYMVFVRYCASFISYLTIFLILASLTGLGYVFQARIDYYNALGDSTYETTMRVLCGIFYALAAIWLIMILFMCNKIRLSIALVEVTADYLSSVWSIFGVPFLFFGITACYYAYWVALSIFLYSTGEISKSNNSFLPEVEWKSTTRYAWWYHLFALFYVTAFIRAFSQFVLASSACIWYFEHRIEGGASKPVTRSFYRGGRYHLGSIAFGSLIVAIIRFMMVVVEYFKQKIDSTGAAEQMGRVYKCLLTCVQCCLDCVARIMEFINKHAYIQIALKGDSFCTSALEGFGLVFRNLGRWSMLFLIGGFFNLLGILFISSSTGLIGYLLITRVEQFSSKLNSPVLPTLVMGLIGFLIGAISMGIYGTSGDAMMHCFLLDEELNDGTPKQTPKELQDFVKRERD